MKPITEDTPWKDIPAQLNHIEGKPRKPRQPTKKRFTSGGVPELLKTAYCALTGCDGFFEIPIERLKEAITEAEEEGLDYLEVTVNADIDDGYAESYTLDIGHDEWSAPEPEVFDQEGFDKAQAEYVRKCLEYQQLAKQNYRAWLVKELEKSQAELDKQKEELARLQKSSKLIGSPGDEQP